MGYPAYIDLVLPNLTSQTLLVLKAAFPPLHFNLVPPCFITMRTGEGILGWVRLCASCLAPLVWLQVQHSKSEVQLSKFTEKIAKFMNKFVNL